MLLLFVVVDHSYRTGSYAMGFLTKSMNQQVQHIPRDPSLITDTVVTQFLVRGIALVALALAAVARSPGQRVVESLATDWQECRCNSRPY
jgi:hypothetical protein